jgi:hypothetical protein
MLVTENIIRLYFRNWIDQYERQPEKDIIIINPFYATREESRIEEMTLVLYIYSMSEKFNKGNLPRHL